MRGSPRRGSVSPASTAAGPLRWSVTSAWVCSRPTSDGGIPASSSERTRVKTRSCPLRDRAGGPGRRTAERGL